MIILLASWNDIFLNHAIIICFPLRRSIHLSRLKSSLFCEVVCKIFFDIRRLISLLHTVLARDILHAELLFRFTSRTNKKKTEHKKRKHYNTSYSVLKTRTIHHKIQKVVSLSLSLSLSPSLSLDSFPSFLPSFLPSIHPSFFTLSLLRKQTNKQTNSSCCFLSRFRAYSLWQ